MLTIALSKGYLLQEALKLLKSLGYKVDELDDRKLIFFDTKQRIQFLVLRPADVPVYVEYGSADLGVTGKDVLNENNSDVLELIDLGFGKCDLIVAAPHDYNKGYFNDMRVATKFTHSADRFFKERALKVELIKLYGSVEVAPTIDLSDIIVDLTATGKTLQENGLKIIDRVYTSTARLIGNKASFHLKNREIMSLLERIQPKI